MGVRAASVRSAVLVRRASSFLDLGVSQVEVLKWIALVCMVMAHADRYLFGATDGFLIHLGRICFPLYAFAVALPVARDPEGRGRRMAFGLFWFAVAAQFLVQPMRESAALNVLFLFLSAGAWLASGDLEVLQRWGVRLLSIVVAFLAEFSLPGLIFIVYLVRAIERRSMGAVIVAAGAFVGISALEGSYFGFAALLVVPLVAWSGFGIRYRRRFFPTAYVLQYVFIWPLRWLT